MTSALAKSVRPVNPQPEQSAWTDKRHDEFAWKRWLSTTETFGAQPAGISFAEPPREETSSSVRCSRILFTLLDSTEAPLNVWIIDSDRIDTDHSARLIQGHMVPSSPIVLTGFEIASMFGTGAISNTETLTEEDQKAESVVRETVLHILNVYAEDDFEPGFVSPLEREFCDLIDNHGYKAIFAMEGELQADRASTSALAEMVRVFGRIREDSTVKARYEACVHALSHRALTVRDAAALALCDLEDPRAAPALREAAEKETNALVRTSHFKIAAWLESLPACQPSSEI